MTIMGWMIVAVVVMGVVAIVNIMWPDILKTARMRNRQDALLESIGKATAERADRMRVIEYDVNGDVKVPLEGGYRDPAPISFAGSY